MDIMDMNDIGIDFTEFFYKLTCRGRRSEAVTVERTGQDTVQSCTPAAADRDNVGGAWPDAVASLAVGAPDAPSVILGQCSDFLHDTPGRRTCSQYRIDLDDAPFFSHY